SPRAGRHSGRTPLGRRGTGGRRPRRGRRPRELGSVLVLLALDTATPDVTVALRDDDRVVATAGGDHPMRHGEQLAPAIAEVLAAVDATPRDVTAIAVGTGPGPFTGLRVGIVTARTMAAVLGIPTYGVCTLDVLAAQAADAGVVA